MVLRTVLLVVLAVFTQVSARASIDMFLKVEGAQGESRDAVHRDECDVLAWSWGMSNSGTVGGIGTGKVNIQDISITKYVDKASPQLMLACAKGTHFTRATLFLRKAGETKQHFMVITMDEVMVTSLSTGGSGGEDRLTENISLNFGKITVDYWQQMPDGSYVKATPFTWNLATPTE
jgi:type VI secretion system secreted protein Hcp